ncbi:hypothetical protein WP1_077 [Pseudomonas phage WP1]
MSAPSVKASRRPLPRALLKSWSAAQPFSASSATRSITLCTGRPAIPWPPAMTCPMAPKASSSTWPPAWSSKSSAAPPPPWI